MILQGWPVHSLASGGSLLGALPWLAAPPFWSGSGAIGNDPNGLLPTSSMPGITIN